MPRPESEALRPNDRSKRSKRSTAALLLGVCAALFAALTVLFRYSHANLKYLYASAAAAFFLAPPACCLGVLGVSARVKDREKRGVLRAILGLVLGLAAGILAAYFLAMRMLRG